MNRRRRRRRRTPQNRATESHASDEDEHDEDFYSVGNSNTFFYVVPFIMNMRKLETFCSKKVNCQRW